jgi:hypothetical protein
MVSLEIMSRDIDKEMDNEKDRILNLQPECPKDSNEMQLLKTIPNGKELIATDRCEVILHLFRNGPMNMKEINDELPGSTEILRDLDSKCLQESRLELTEKGERIGSMLEKVEKEMEE